MTETRSRALTAITKSIGPPISHPKVKEQAMLIVIMGDDDGAVRPSGPTGKPAMLVERRP